MKIKVVGKSLLLLENCEWDSDGKVDVKIENWGKFRKKNPHLQSLSLGVCGGYSCGSYDLRDDGCSSLNLDNNSSYSMQIIGSEDGNNSVVVASGRFSVCQGVVCDDPDCLVLNFGDIKSAIIALSNEIDELEEKTAEIKETLNGYTTE